MPRFKYSVIGLDPDKTALASAREVSMSHKHAREVCNTIKGMMLDDAKQYLEDVIAMKRSVPFKRHHKKGGHRSDLIGWDVGRYPVKVSKIMLDLLESAEKNAEFKGLEVDKLQVIHAAAQKGRLTKRMFYRAFRSSSAKNDVLTHVEIALEER